DPVVGARPAHPQGPAVRARSWVDRVHRPRHGRVRAPAAAVVSDAREMVTVADAPRDRRLELALVVGFALVVGAAMFRHEMWRDELQAWLIAKASSTPSDLLHNTRFEGHPILWYAVLWPFAHMSHAPRLEQAIEWTLAIAATALVVLRAPLTR